MNNENNPIEVCVICGKETPYHFNDHIDMRYGYVEGVGQTCRSCYDRGTKREHIAIPTDVIYDTSNDQELGAKVRQFYWQNQ
jgi:hypothetical protein